MLLARLLLAPDAPFRFCTDPLALGPSTEGGGGTMPAPRTVPRDVVPAEPVAADTDGGGGTTFDPSELVPNEPRRAIPEAAGDVVPEAEGGGGTTFAARVPPDEPGLRVAEATAGGGGTTSCVPKSLPIMLLTKDGLPV